MEIKTKEFQTSANTILFAAGLDKKGAANLELNAHDSVLELNVTNKEYYVSVKFALETEETFRAVVDASLFLNLISGITSETFDLKVTEQAVTVKAGKSKYNLSMIYDNDRLMTLSKIELHDTEPVAMTISSDILNSIVNINSKELLKAKGSSVQELQKMYYIDGGDAANNIPGGCFTFVTGACLNRFTLDKPIKLLLNDRIIKLFKLFESDVDFKFGHDTGVDGKRYDKVIFKNDSITVAANVTCDDILLNRVQGPCTATKGLIDTPYANHLVMDVNKLLAAISRLMLFTKNSVEGLDAKNIPATIIVDQDEISISDKNGNTEVVGVENGSYADENGYSMVINLVDLKLALDTYRNDHVTIDFGNHRSVVIKPNQVDAYHLIPEGKSN